MGTPFMHPQNGGGAPKFSAHVYCGQTPGWIKMALGTEVGLGPGDFVFNGDPVPLPNCRPICSVANRLDASRCHLVWR